MVVEVGLRRSPPFKNGLHVFSKRLSIVWSDISLTIKYDDHASSTLWENCKLQVGYGATVHSRDDV